MRQIKPAPTNTYRFATYDFLLTFYSNLSLSRTYRFRDKQRFQSKIAKFSHTPCILRPCWRNSPWNWIPALGVKYYWWRYHGRSRSLTISSAVWIQSTNVTDRQTDRHRRQQRPRLCTASRGKNQLITGHFNAEIDCMAHFNILTYLLTYCVASRTVISNTGRANVSAM